MTGRNFIETAVQSGYAKRPDARRYVKEHKEKAVFGTEDLLALYKDARPPREGKNGNDRESD